MDPQQLLHAVMSRTVVLRFPRKRLATFGATEILYHLVTPVEGTPTQSLLREGLVKSQRPRIITRETLLHRFQGFGPESEAFEQFLKNNFSDSFRSLEYTFHNELQRATPHQDDPRVLARSIKKDLEARNAERETVIVGPAEGWNLSLMKFILEETSQSFAANVRELDEHGLFDPGTLQDQRRRRDIEQLFRQAETEPSKISTLAHRLKQEHLFEEYEDRFFRLVQRGSSR